MGNPNDFDTLAVSLYCLATVSTPKDEQVRLAQRGLDLTEMLYQLTGIPLYQTLIVEFNRLL